jgi:hypothetical protein
VLLLLSWLVVYLEGGLASWDQDCLPIWSNNGGHLILEETALSLVLLLEHGKALVMLLLLG